MRTLTLSLTEEEVSWLMMAIGTTQHILENPNYKLEFPTDPTALAETKANYTAADSALTSLLAKIENSTAWTDA